MPIYSVEYSVRKKDYLIQTWERMLEVNHDAVMEGKKNDYTLLSVALSPKEAEKIVNEHQALLNRKEFIYVQQPNGMN
jgi:hypothetical protein